MAGHEIQLITTTAQREPEMPMGHVTPMPLNLLSPEAITEWMSRGGRVEYAFPDVAALMAGREAVSHMFEANQVTEALDYLRSKTTKMYEDKGELEKWAHMSVQLPEDWGPHGTENRADMRNRLTAMSKGMVLETMCGFTTYIEDAPHIKNVVAMDWCKEGLERYPRTDRTRVLFDLNTIGENGGMDFVRNGGFDTVSITFGVDYLDNPLDVYREFYRILSDNGNVLLIGGEGNGYQDQMRRWFRPDFHVPLLEEAGFRADVTSLPYRQPGEQSEYYLIEGSK